MKTKFILLLISLLSVTLLCSFEHKQTENENICLQKSAKNIENAQSSFEEEAFLKESEEDELKKIYEDFISALPEGTPTDSNEISGALGIKEVFGFIGDTLTTENSVETLILFLAIGILFAIAELFVSDLGDAKQTALSAVAVILSIPVFNVMKDVIFEVSESLSGSTEIFSGIIPALTALLAVGSGGSASALSGASMSASLGFVSHVLSENLLPLCAMMFSISLVSSFDTGGITDGTAKGIRSIFNFLIGLSSLVIIAIVGMQTVIAVSADNLALKSAKYAVSGMIPVVGGTVSGALSALISGVKLLSSSIGTVSVVALLSVVGVPLIRLLFYRFCLFLCITVSSFSGASFGSKFFTSVRSSLDTLIAVLVSSSMIYILETVIITGSIRGAL